MAELDPRVVQVSVEVNGVLKTYEGISIIANGTKYANPLQNDAEITLTNLDKVTQDYLLTETSPYNLNKTQKLVSLYAGRQSYGTALIYRGNIISSSVSQPPDIGVTLKCLTGNFYKGNLVTRNQPAGASLNQISQGIANDLNLILNFQADEKNISNFNFAGAALKQVDLLNSMGNVNAYVDDANLVVKNAFVPLRNSLRVLSASTGMIGIPEFTEQGIKVKFLVDNVTTLGSSLQIQSEIYPAANGVYVIYKLGFQITNRDTPFYFIAEAARIR